MTKRPSLTLLPTPLHPLASSTFTSPHFQPISMSRTVTHSGLGHTLMGRTWNTESTIPCLISFYRSSSASDDGSGHRPPPVIHDDPDVRFEVRRFYVFGGDLTAHPGLLHGGVVGCILDSGLGGAVGLGVGLLRREGREREGQRRRGMEVRLGVDGDGEGDGEGEGAEGQGGVQGDKMEQVRDQNKAAKVTTVDSMFTVQLNVRYRAPVRAPGGVMVRSWVTRIEEGGRKVWAAGRVEGPNGVVHAEAEGMWLRGKAKL